MFSLCDRQQDKWADPRQYSRPNTRSHNRYSKRYIRRVRVQDISIYGRRRDVAALFLKLGFRSAIIMLYIARVRSIVQFLAF